MPRKLDPYIMQKHAQKKNSAPSRAALEARIAELEAHIIKSDEFVERNGQFPVSCIFEAKELLDERRALLKKEK